MIIRHFELIEIANEFLSEYGMKMDIPLKFNPRSKRRLGCYFYNKDKKTGDIIPLHIDLSQQMLISASREQIVDVLKHELVHYALSVQGKNFSDGDYDFESELRRRGVKSTGYYKGNGYAHVYKCNLCNVEYTRYRKIPHTAQCSCSIHSKLTYLGTKEEMEKHEHEKSNS